METKAKWIFHNPTRERGIGRRRRGSDVSQSLAHAPGDGGPKHATSETGRQPLALTTDLAYTKAVKEGGLAFDRWQPIATQIFGGELESTGLLNRTLHVVVGQLAT